jgi:hypothetical protein
VDADIDWLRERMTLDWDEKIHNLANNVNDGNGQRSQSAARRSGGPAFVKVEIT